MRKKKAPQSGAVTLSKDPVCRGRTTISADWQSWQVAFPETAGSARQFAPDHARRTKKVGRLIRAHPDSQISAITAQKLGCSFCASPSPATQQGRRIRFSSEKSYRKSSLCERYYVVFHRQSGLGARNFVA
jgi:hypothetical protein